MEAKQPPHGGKIPPIQLKPVAPPARKIEQTPQNHQVASQPSSVAGINPMLMKPVLSESKAQQAAAIAMAMAKQSYNAQTNPETNSGLSSASAVYSPLRGGVDIDTAAQAKPSFTPMNQPPMKPMSPEGMAMAQAKAAAGISGTGNRMIISAKPGPPTHAMDMSGQYVAVATQRASLNHLDEGKDATPSSSSSQLPQQQRGISSQTPHAVGLDQQQATSIQTGVAGGGRGNNPNSNIINPKPILTTSRRTPPGGSSNVSPYGSMLGSKPGTISEKNSVRFKPLSRQPSIISNSSQVTPVDDSVMNRALSVSRAVDQISSQHNAQGEKGGVIELVPYHESLSSQQPHLAKQHSQHHVVSNRALLAAGQWRNSGLLGQGRKTEKQPSDKGVSFIGKGAGDSYGQMAHDHAQGDKPELPLSLVERVKRGWNVITRTHASVKAWRNRTFSPAETK